MTDDAGRSRDHRADADATGDEAEMVRFLEARPDFLARHPTLYLTLSPPARVHGERVADHMAAMLGAARRQNALLAAGLSRRRVDASFGHRVEAAVLQMVRAADPVEWIAAELAHALGLDSAAICFDDARPEGRLDGARPDDRLCDVRPDGRLDHARPGARPEHARPGVRPDHARPDIRLDRARADIPPDDARPGVKLEHARPGVKLEHARPGMRREHARPGVRPDHARAEIPPDHARPGVRRLPPGRVGRLLGGQDLRFRADPGDAAAIHGEAAPLIRHDALLRLRLEGRTRDSAASVGMLALGSRDDALPGPEAARALGLLARAVEAALARATVARATPGSAADGEDLPA